MPAEKRKPSPTEAKWTNQVVRTSDGRFVVRGVDVPAKGSTWSKVAAGQLVGQTVVLQHRSAATGQMLTPVTNKAKALATAKRAGLVQQQRTGQAKK
jgi:hypothetical protein